MEEISLLLRWQILYLRRITYALCYDRTEETRIKGGHLVFLSLPRFTEWQSITPRRKRCRLQRGRWDLFGSEPQSFRKDGAYKFTNYLPTRRTESE